MSQSYVGPSHHGSWRLRANVFLFYRCNSQATLRRQAVWDRLGWRQHQEGHREPTTIP